MKFALLYLLLISQLSLHDALSVLNKQTKYIRFTNINCDTAHFYGDPVAGETMAIDDSGHYAKSLVTPWLRLNITDTKKLFSILNDTARVHKAHGIIEQMGTCNCIAEARVAALFLAADSSVIGQAMFDFHSRHILLYCLQNGKFLPVQNDVDYFITPWDWDGVVKIFKKQPLKYPLSRFRDDRF
jgi:hypothetical protein